MNLEDYKDMQHRINVLQAEIDHIYVILKEIKKVLEKTTDYHFCKVCSDAVKKENMCFKAQQCTIADCGVKKLLCEE